MNLATWSIRNPVPTLLLFIFMAGAGVWGLRSLGMQTFPDIDFPLITVNLAQPGAAPAQLETEIARKVEDSLVNLDELRHINTSITDGMINMSVEFEIGRGLSDALIDVKDAIDRIRNELPADMEDPVVRKATIGPGGPLAIYAITHADLDREALSWFVDDHVESVVRGINGVGEFRRLGGSDREIRVEVDPIRMSALGVTVTDVSRTLKQVQQDASGGKGEVGGLEQGVRTLGTVKAAAELKDIVIPIAGGRLVRLGQIATISDTIAEPTQEALVDGVPAVGFQIKALKGKDQVTIFNEVQRALDALLAEDPKLGIRLVSTSTTNILDQFDGSMQMLIDGSLLAVLVIWLFLRNWRATLIGAVALPLSILPTFAAMEWLGFTLNTVTLLGLAVVIGILVDDAVVEVENIARHMQSGKPVKQATEDAVNEISTAVIGTTFTLVAVFLPTAFMTGVAGMVFEQFGWSVVVAVVASLLVARMVTPMMAIWLLRPEPVHASSEPSYIMQWYLRAVRRCLQHRRLTLLAGTAFFFGSLSLLPLMQTEFMPPEDNGMLELRVELPPGSNLEDTMAAVDEVEHALADLEGIDSIFSVAGSAQAAIGMADATGMVRKASMTLVLSARETRPSQQTLAQRVRERLSTVNGMRVNFAAMHPGEQFQITLLGNDSQKLNASARAIAAELREIEPLTGVNSTASLDRAEITVRPNFLLMADMGISTQQIGETLRVALAGDFEPALAKLNLDNRQIDIRVQFPESAREDLDRIRHLRLHSNQGLVPLGAVADVRLENGPSQIDRLDRQRQVVITADLNGYPVGAAMQDRDAMEPVKNLPQGITLSEVGDAERMLDIFSAFSGALLIGLIMIFAVLVLLFQSWLQPITILSATPLSIGGAFVAIMLAGHNLGLPILIGIIMLMGVVTKNSILLVDFAVMAREQNALSIEEAIIDACLKRARPIVMTTIAMIAGLTPLALGYGGGASLRQPMAIAVIGGLITSTALSLLVVPVVYVYMSRFQALLDRWFGSSKTPGDEDHRQSISPVKAA